MNVRQMLYREWRSVPDAACLQVEILPENFSFFIDTPGGGAIVRCVIKQYILQEGGNADGEKNKQAGQDCQIPHPACP